jgi:hypothetical protein
MFDWWCARYIQFAQESIGGKSNFREGYFLLLFYIDGNLFLQFWLELL